MTYKILKYKSSKPMVELEMMEVTCAFDFRPLVAQNTLILNL